jgi:OPA family glycerol-3-phosphate transporter-like MFS transporter/OPA family sugar phosphate sensor protein UhpC-like MFS transporter
VIIDDPAEVGRRYAHYRPRILLWTTVGYGAFYFVRKNLAIAQPVMEHQLGIPKSQLGLFLTLHGVLYGVSKFFNGVVGDRADGRKFMALGLIVSALLNVCFGFSTSVVALGIFWMINGWFQGMGYPPCARLLTHWFGPKELATKMAIWNASHTIGASITLILCGYLVTHDWRFCFFVPAGIALAIAGSLLLWLRDTPESVGLPEIAGTATLDSPNDETSDEDFAAFLRRRVFSNKYIWIVSGANFFVYTLRFAVFDWGATLLREVKGVQIARAAWMLCGFEFAGWIGVLITGWLTDRYFGGRGARVCLACMLLAGVSLFLFWKTPSQSTWVNAALLMSTGFFIYGPQSLVAVIVANLATKRAAATAVGLTSIFGYASTVLSGWGLGALVQHYGWTPAFISLIVVAGMGALLFAAALPAKAHGYAIIDDGA